MNKQLSILIMFLFLLSAAGLKAQVSINQDNSNPDPSAMLDVKSTGKGMLIPRMTTAQRTTISNPATGLLVFDQTTGGFWFFNGTAWQNLSADADADPANELQNLSGVLAQGNDAGGAGITNLGAVSASSFTGDGSGLTGIPDNQTLDLTGTTLTIEDGNSVDLANLAQSTGWSLTGNTGTTPGTNFIGTSDNVPLELRVNNSRMLRLEYGIDQGTVAPNIIGGSPDNNVSAGIVGATIAGGSGYPLANEIKGNGHYGSIGGGYANSVSGKYATIPGGVLNSALGTGSFAAGTYAVISAAHNGAMLFSDYADDTQPFYSNAANEFAARATGGVRFVTAIDGAGNPAQTVSIDNTGTVTAAAFVGDGSGLTNVPPGNGWRLTGNTGTDTTINFIGTTDNMPLDFRVNNARALRLQYAEFAGSPIPNFISGYPGNWVSNGVYGATIVGGGGPFSNYANRVTGNWGTVVGGVSNSAEKSSAVVVGGESNHATNGLSAVIGGYFNNATGEIATIIGGQDNVASGRFSTVLSGNFNTAAGFNSVAAGRRAKANHDGSFVFAAGASGINSNFVSLADEEFAVRARGGVRFVTAVNGSGNPTQTVSIDNTGTITAAAFVGDGSGLTGLVAPGDNLGNHTATQALNLNGNNINNGGTVTATAFVGNGSSLTGVPGDNLGAHTATQALNLNSNNIINGGTVTAAAFIGNGSGLTGIPSDNLGNHTATQNLNLNGHYLSGDGGNEGIFVDASGKVGIGDNTPAEVLEVAGNTQLTGDDPDLVFFDNAGTNGTRTSSIRNTLVSQLGNDPSSAQKMEFYVNNAHTMILQGDGRVGIGTTTPAATLDVAGIVNNGTLVKLQNGGSTNAQILQVFGNTTDDSDIVDIQNGAFVVQGNGNVGIGTTAPQGPLHILDSGGTNLRIEESSNEFSGVITSNSQHNYFMGVTGPNDGASDNWHLYDNTAGAPRITVKANGNVGIGTANPQAPLHVNGTTTIASFSGANNGGAWMYEASGAGSDEIGFANAAGSTPVSIYANGSIVADGEGVFVAATVNWSDERIKHIEGISDARQDLETLNQIEITDYRRVDGGKREKKVIAQQLREVFPQAVSLREGVIPSIYEHIQNFSFNEEEGLLAIETAKPHELRTGDRIDYYTETGKFDRQEVVEILSETTFRVKAETAPQELFMFGKWVNDVHSVDYDAISMLNVSATQEQQRIIEAQEKRIAELEAQNANLKTEFEKRLTRLEGSLQNRALEGNSVGSSEK